MSNELDDVIAGLLAERYQRPTWWRTPPTTRVDLATVESEYMDDSDVACARRRRQAAADYDRFNALADASEEVL